MGQRRFSPRLAAETSGDALAFVEKPVNFSWAICIAREDAASLAALRLTSGIEAAEDRTSIWLRGKRADERLAAALASIPARARYEWFPSGQLRQMHQRIPSGRLPELRWQSLNTSLRVEMPVAAMPADLPRPMSLRLVRSVHEREPELLATSLDELIAFSKMAAQVRLDRLQFAVNAEGQALVRGRPLPALPGRRFVIHGGVAVPSGFSWEPAVNPDVLARRLGVSGDALVIWNDDGSVTRLLGEQFVPLSRSALLASREALDDLK